MKATKLITKLRTVLNDLKAKRHDALVIINLISDQGYKHEAGLRLDKVNASSEIIFELESVVDIAEREINTAPEKFITVTINLEAVANKNPEYLTDLNSILLSSGEKEAATKVLDYLESFNTLPR